jgi:phosphoglycerol transferase MdoB-like AlkP superfamily enzyme
MSFLGLILLPFLNAKKRYKHAFALDVTISIILISDVVYLRYFGSLMSVQSISLATSATNVSDSIFNLLKPIDILFVIDLPLSYLAQRNLQRKYAEKLPKNNKEIYWGLTLLLVAMSLFIFIYDFNNIKLLTTKTFDNRVIAERYGVGAFHVLDIYSFASTKFYHLSAEEKQNIISEAKSHIPKVESNSKTGIAKGKNVILLQVE